MRRVGVQSDASSLSAYPVARTATMATPSDASSVQAPHWPAAAECADDAVSPASIACLNTASCRSQQTHRWDSHRGSQKTRWRVGAGAPRRSRALPPGSNAARQRHDWHAVFGIDSDSVTSALCGRCLHAPEAVAATGPSPGPQYCVRAIPTARHTRHGDNPESPGCASARPAFKIGHRGVCRDCPDRRAAGGTQQCNLPAL